MPELNDRNKISLLATSFLHFSDKLFIMRFLFLVIIFLFAIVIQSYPVDDGFEALPQLSGNGDALTSSVLQSPIENQFTTEALAGNPTSDLKEEFVDPQTEPQPEESIESQRGPQLEVLVPENPTSVLAETPTEPQEDLPDAAEQFDATAQCALATRSKERPSPAGRVLTKPECKPRRKWPHVDFSSENPVMENPIAVCCNDFPLHRADWHRHMQRVQNCVACEYFSLVRSTWRPAVGP